jgi:hypothetical protein
MTTPVTLETRRPFGPCERDDEGNCIGRCGRRGHLGRPLNVAEWLHFFGQNARAKDSP